MPSIEQCDGAAGNVAALPSTLEIFDKFKPTPENGKDSDSEESFHLPLEDDDLENQSVVSNGRDKEIHNEETEDDILNKFETAPSLSSDHIDPHIEDSILNDVDDNMDAEKTLIDQSSQKSNDKSSNIEVKITCDFENYEDSGDGEFKSVYETDSEAAEQKNEKETPMEVSNEAQNMNQEPPSSDATQKQTELDNFQDCMELEQEDTSHDIADIIDKLEDTDTPMEDCQVAQSATEVNKDLPQPDINMTETSKEVLGNNKLENNEEESRKDCAPTDNDVEMSGDAQVQEEHKENLEQDATFQESMEVPKDPTEVCTEESEKPVSVAEASCSNDTENGDYTEPLGKLEEDIVLEEHSESDESKEDQKESSSVLVPDQSTVVNQQQHQGPAEAVTLESKDVNSNGKPNSLTEKEASPDNSLLPDESFKELDEKVEEETTEKAEKRMCDEPEVSEECKENDQPEECNENDKLEEKRDEPEASEESEKKNEAEATQQTTDNEELKSQEDDKMNEIETRKESDGAEESEEKVDLKDQSKPTEEEKPSTDDDEVFKVPEDVPKEPEESNPDDEESDLLDISMVRETDEDDACAMADAIEEISAMDDTDKETQASEKSDEEQSEKMETEQEGSDLDKDQDSNEDNDHTMALDELDDDSRMDGDDSSNAEASVKSQSKIIEISESSKDSVSDSDVRKRKISDVVAPTEKVEKLNTTNQQEIMVEKAPSETNGEVQSSIIEKSADNTQATDTSKTDDDSVKTKDHSECVENVGAAKETDAPDKVTEDSSEKRISFNKRSHSANEIVPDEVLAKKPRLDVENETQKEAAEKPSEISRSEQIPLVKEKVKTLTAFSKFMQCRKLTAKLSRSDLEQFCIQKICESLMLKSTEGDLHQTIQKHEKTIDNLRKDLQQLTKQCKDLEIVNKKLMNELKNQNSLKKPLVPLKITRSVGLQVRLNPGNEVPNQNRRRPMTTTPQKQVMSSPNNVAANRAKVAPASGQQNTAVRQVMQQNSPQKSPLTTAQTTTSPAANPMLAQALQKRQSSVVAKRTTTPIRKPAEASKPSNPGVIDLTDEDDKIAQNKQANNTIKIINKTVSPAVTPNKTGPASKIGSAGKTIVSQGKQMAVSKSAGTSKGNALSQGIRLTPTSVITSSANGSPQMVYVVPTITSNAGGQQKVAFVNFQSNGVLSGALNGSTVSVMSNKPGQTLTLKTMPNALRHRHPAALPTPPRINPDPKLKPLLPKPILTIKKIDQGIILQWKMPYNLDLYESIASYQLYAYQETSALPSTDMWRKVGDVKALALPMACTLTQFADKNKYYFAVRSVDVHKRIGAFSDPEEISL